MSVKAKAFLPALVLFLVIFVLSFILFYQIRPVVLFNTDDWQYISIDRPAIPLPGNWNPTRVFPEVFMPLCSSAASFFIMPLTNDYVGSLKITCAFVYSLFIAIYILLFYSLVQRRFKANVVTAVFASALFYLFHFIVLQNGVFLFQTATMTDLFYYGFPNILCCALVLYLMNDDLLENFFSPERYVKKGLFLLALYFALFSNLFTSCVVAAYVGVGFIWGCLCTIREKADCRSFIRQSLAKPIVLIVWLIVQVLEVTGGRAHSLAALPFFDGVIASVRAFVKLDFDVLYVALIVVVLALFFATVFRPAIKRASDSRVTVIGVSALAGFVTLAYLIVLCARAGAGYMQRPDVVASVFFFANVCVTLSLVMVIERWPMALIAAPMVLVLIALCVPPIPHTSWRGMGVDVQEGVTNAIIDQVKKGVAEGKSSVEVHVPEFGSTDNFPLGDYAAFAVGNSLYRHGVVDRLVDVRFVRDPALNEELGIPLAAE